MTTPLPWISRLAVLLSAGAVLLLALGQLEPPAPLAGDAPAGEFSATRALAHVRHVARAPHPVGSVEHDAVRDYIVAELTRIGVTPEIQRATVSQHETSARLDLYDVENIVARLPGTGGSRRALLLIGHYDSVPTGPGASDDGHAVAALLETLRALRAGPPLAHDVLFLFSDGEEQGLLGARAFAAESPHRGDVALALNFEARGTGGPAFLFQISPGGSGLARTLGRAAPHPIASSLLGDIYRRLPNDTDLSELMRAGIPGMNFAYFDNYPGYHAQGDTAAALDPGSLQHQGDTALALARAFGDGELAVPPAPAATWFNATRSWLIWYPSVVDPIVLAVTVLGFGWLIARGRRRGQLRLGGVALGGLCFTGALVACPALAHVVWAKLAPYLVPAMPAGEPASAGFCRAAFVALTLAGALAVFGAGRRFARAGELALGALGALLVIAATLVVVAPGGAYLVVWPALFALLACAAVTGAPGGRALSAGRTLGLGLGAAVALWLVAPWIHLLFVLLAFRQIAVVVAVAVIVIGLALPALLAVTEGWGWRAPAALAALGGAALLVGLRSGGATAAHPASDSIAYALDADAHQARWITDQRPHDAWTSRLIADAEHRTALDGFFPFTDWTFYQAPAPAAELPAPDLRVLDNRVEAGVRRLRLCLRAGGPAEATLVYLASGARVHGVELAGRRFDHQQPSTTARWAVSYSDAPQGGFELVLETDDSAPVALRVVDQYFGLLPAVAAPARPEQLIQTPFGFGPSDQTYVGQSFADLQAAAPAPPGTACAGAPRLQTAIRPASHPDQQSSNATP